MTATAAARVTVIIPVWGRYTGVVGDAVASAHAGSVTARVIVVDNANEPPLTALDGAEIVRSEVRLSRGAIRNAGLAEARTDYVVFLDADDVLLPGGLDHLVAGLDTNAAAGAFVGRIVEGDGAVHRLPRSLCSTLARVPRLLAWTNAVWPVMSIQGCAIMRTAAVRAAGGYPDASSGEDWALATALAFGGPVAFTKQPVLRYWLHGESPGVHGPTARVLRRSARLVRRGVAARGTRRPALALLATVQTMVILGLRPPARLTRRSVAALTAGQRRG